MTSQQNLPKLTPVTSTWMDTITKQPKILNNLFERYGSPINIHHLASFDKNISGFTAVLNRHKIKNQIMFARKANKSKCLVKRAHDQGIGVDTASFNELKQCLDLGLPPKKLVLTAAVKNKALLRLAIETKVPIILDNPDEFKLTAEIAKELNTTAKIGIRLSGFIYNNKKLYSRFGFDIDEALTFIKGQLNNNTFKYLNFKGLHFHLDGYSISQRSQALWQTIKFSQNLKKLNLHTAFIDMGGGILINYLKDKSQWNDFQDQLKLAIDGQRSEITFNNNGLGFQKINGYIHGQLATYPFYNECNGSDFLDKILDSKFDGISIAQHITDADIELRLEPGRSLLNQVGITIAKVAFRKKDSKGNNLIGLEMNMSQMASSSADFLLDPVLINTSEDTQKNEKCEVYFTGAYCLERDILLKRKIPVKRLPKIGDTVVFFNTAGYMMHFFETEAHLFDLSQNLYFEGKSESNSVEDFKVD